MDVGRLLAHQSQHRNLRAENAFLERVGGGPQVLARFAEAIAAALNENAVLRYRYAEDGGLIQLIGLLRQFVRAKAFQPVHFIDKCIQTSLNACAPVETGRAVVLDRTSV